MSNFIGKIYDRLKHLDDSDCAAGAPFGLSEQQRKLDASVSPWQARIDVDRERKALADLGKVHPHPDGFINDYD